VGLRVDHWARALFIQKDKWKGRDGIEKWLNIEKLRTEKKELLSRVKEIDKIIKESGEKDKVEEPLKW